MRTGIMRAILVSFPFGGAHRIPYSDEDGQRNKERFIKHAPKYFFDFYDTKSSYEEERSNKKQTATYCKIKSGMLLSNFKNFFFKFHNLNDDCNAVDAYDKFGDEYDAIAVSGNLDRVTEYFSGGSKCPLYIFPCFEPAYIAKCVYQNGYQSVPKKYSSLSHMGHLLQAAMKTPAGKRNRMST
jgi:hypothetical protein